MTTKSFLLGISEKAKCFFLDDQQKNKEPFQEMHLLIMFLLLATVPDQSLEEDDKEQEGAGEGEGKEEEEEEEEEEEGEEEEDTGSGISPKIQKQIVDRHNEIRRNVDPPASNMLKMVWDDTIGERAKRWVDKCQQTMSPKSERTINETFCGEIVFQANYINSWAEVLDFWHGKKENFQYGVGAINPQVNIYPYTQMIWYNSYRIGCAATHCKDAKYPFFYVCQYCPSGNLQDQIATPYKSGQFCGDCLKNCDNKLCTNPCKYANKSMRCQKMKEQFSCKNRVVKENCRASCRCKKSIV